ncbi:TPA: histidinol-phosphate aminotransferase family protein [Thermoplasmata archaeon]|nr:histidinol-phosphate aminotransferase family protein [Thermoplasmata archaeon]
MPSIGELRRTALESLSRPSYSLASSDMLLLNDNANLFGVNPAAVDAAEKFDFSRLWAYPSENSDALRTRLASEFEVSPREIIVGNGSDELLDIVCKTFINPGDVFCQPAPTFSMYKFYAKANFAVVKEIVLRDDFTLPVDELLEQRAKLTALCQPNNPTANLLDADSVGRVLAESEGLTILDEAYSDFCDSNMMREVMSCERAIDIRTFSKAYGIAGLRAGFAVSREEVVDEMRRVRTPFGLNTFTESVAIAALDNGEWVRAQVQEMKVQREYLAKMIEPLGFGVYPSECNFLLCKSPISSETLVRAMRKNGVAIRDCGAYPLLRDHVRVTIGPRPMMEKFLEVLRLVLNEVS